MLYRQAYWNPERIPDSELQPNSFLSMIRISQTRQPMDPVTGKMRLDDTDLVRRARMEGTSEEKLLELASFLTHHTEANMQMPPAGSIPSLPDGYSDFPPDEFAHRFPSSMANENMGSKAAKLSNRELLLFLKNDIYGDVCGHVPLSSLNYAWVAVSMLMFFMGFEDELRKRQNPVWVRAYETDPTWASNKRVGLTFLAMAEEDDECLRVMAEGLQNPRVEFMDHIYWDTLDPFAGEKKTSKRARTAESVPEPECTVM